MMKTVNGYKDGTTIVNSCKDGPGWGHLARCARNVLLIVIHHNCKLLSKIITMIKFPQKVQDSYVVVGFNKETDIAIHHYQR